MEKIPKISVSAPKCYNKSQPKFKFFEEQLDFSGNPSIKDMLINRYKRIVSGRHGDHPITVEEIATAKKKLKELTDEL
jgi:hypothetical protein